MFNRENLDFDMNVPEVIVAGKRALCNSAKRDPKSGGFLRGNLLFHGQLYFSYIGIQISVLLESFLFDSFTEVGDWEIRF